MSLSSITKHGSSQVTLYLLYLTLVATLGPFHFGYHIAELNTPQAVLTCSSDASSVISKPHLPQCIPMNRSQFGFVSSIYTLGGLLGALSAGPLSTRSGRLYVMRLTTLFLVVGPILEALAPAIWVIAVGRFLSGIGAGAAITVVPIYVSEIAPPDSKGIFGALTQVMVCFGLLATQIAGYFLSHGNMWRVVLGIAGMIGVLQAAGLFLAAESPEWLAQNGKTGLARQVLQRIRGKGSNIEEETSAWNIESDGTNEEEPLMGTTDSRSKQPKPLSILTVFTSPRTRPAVFAVIGVMLAQQLCGINSIVMYSVSVLSPILPTTASLITVFIGVLNLLVTILCAPLADKLGRRICLLLSIAGMGMNALLLAIGILYNIKILSAIATLLFVASFAVGLGPVPFILASELVGPEAVGATQSWALSANWIATFVVAQFFPPLDAALGTGKVYFVFAASAVGFWGFVWGFVPETRGKRDVDEVWGRGRRED